MEIIFTIWTEALLPATVRGHSSPGCYSHYISPLKQNNSSNPLPCLHIYTQKPAWMNNTGNTSMSNRAFPENWSSKFCHKVSHVYYSARWPQGGFTRDIPHCLKRPSAKGNFPSCICRYLFYTTSSFLSLQGSNTFNTSVYALLSCADSILWVEITEMSMNVSWVFYILVRLKHLTININYQNMVLHKHLSPSKTLL